MNVCNYKLPTQDWKVFGFVEDVDGFTEVPERPWSAVKITDTSSDPTEIPEILQVCNSQLPKNV